jgi:phosphate-selective porin OprO/OprP
MIAHFKTIGPSILMTLFMSLAGFAVADDRGVGEGDAVPEGPVESETTQEVSEQVEHEAQLEAAQAEVAAREANPITGPIYKLFHDQEFPLLGIRWGGGVFLDAPINDEPDGAALTFRRAWLTFRRGMGEDWRIKLSAEVLSSEFEVRDNYIEYLGWPTRIVRFGVFREPFSLEQMTRAKSLTFMERSLPVAALSPGRGIGAGTVRRTEKGIFSSGLYFRSPSEDGLGEAGEALTFRFVRSPLRKPEDESRHVGVSISYRINAEPDDSRYRTRPESGVTDSYFVDTGEIAGADQIVRAGLETSTVNGPFSWQAEIIGMKVERKGFRNVLLYGGYVYGSWVLTGESRNYDKGIGTYHKMEPAGSWPGGGKGLWELTARFSYVDLTDKDIVGGRQSNVTLGINWQINNRIRIMANLIKVLDVDRPGSEFDGESPLIFSLRLQWDS